MKGGGAVKANKTWAFVGSVPEIGPVPEMKTTAFKSTVARNNAPAK